MCELEKKGIRQVDRTICISPQDSRDLWKEVGVETIGYLPPSCRQKCDTGEKIHPKRLFLLGGYPFIQICMAFWWMLGHVWHDFLVQYPDYRLVITGEGRRYSKTETTTISEY